MGRIKMCERCQVEFADIDDIRVDHGVVAHADVVKCDEYLRLREKGVKTVIGRGSLGRDPRIVGEATALEGHHLEVWVDGEKLVGQGVTVLSTKGEAPKGPDLSGAETKLKRAEEALEAELDRLIIKGDRVDLKECRRLHDALDLAMGDVHRARNDLKWQK